MDLRMQKDLEKIEEAVKNLKEKLSEKENLIVSDIGCKEEEDALFEDFQRPKFFILFNTALKRYEVSTTQFRKIPGCTYFKDFKKAYDLAEKLNKNM